jgi:opacity protein-like surface antigen
MLAGHRARQAFGAEAQWSWSTASGNYNFITTTTAGATASGIFNSNQNWYNTVAGRIGYVIGNYVLCAKGGGAGMNVNYGLSVTPFAGGSVNLSRSGYVARGGAEWMFYPAWSAKVEYNYLDFRQQLRPAGRRRASVNSHSSTFRSAWIGIRAGFDRERVRWGFNNSVLLAKVE